MGLLQYSSPCSSHKKKRRIILLGLENCGKTTLLNTLLDKERRAQQPTRTFNIVTISLKLEATNSGPLPQLTGDDAQGGSSFAKMLRRARERTRKADGEVSVVDMGGSAEVRGFWKDFYGDAEDESAIVFVVDSASFSAPLMSWASCEETGSDSLHLLQTTFTEVMETSPSHANVLVLANKQDQEHANSPRVVADVLRLSHWHAVRAGRLGCMGCSFLSSQDADGNGNQQEGSAASASATNTDRLRHALRWVVGFPPAPDIPWSWAEHAQFSLAIRTAVLALFSVVHFRTNEHGPVLYLPGEVAYHICMYLSAPADGLYLVS